MKNIHIPMLDNGLDFILKSLETIDKEDENLKYSVIHLHAGIQLLLKELLYQEHWSLIFQKIDTADKKKLKSGDFVSVNHSDLIDRLQKIVGIKMDKDFLVKLDWLRKERNIAEHYQFVVTADVLKSNISKLLTQLIPFIMTHLVETKLISSDDTRLKEIKDYLNRFEIYVKEKLKQIEDTINGLDLVLECPEYTQQSVEFIDGASAYCHFCAENIKDFGDKYIDKIMKRAWRIHDGGPDPVHECPECEMEMMIYLDGHDYVCLECGEPFTQDELITCDGPICGGILVYKRYEDEAHFCHHCNDYFRSA